MKRREFLVALSTGIALTGCQQRLLSSNAARSTLASVPEYSAQAPVDPPRDSEQVSLLDNTTENVSAPSSDSALAEGATQLPVDERLKRIEQFDGVFADDMWLPEPQRPLLMSVLQRFQRLQKLVGYGNFNVLGFDDAIKFAARYSSVGAFTAQELDYIDELFHFDARKYGFYGDRVSDTLTEKLSRRDIFKVPYTGHYLFKGESLAHYHKLQKDIGEGVILTSGIRSNVKQIHLFLAKAAASDFNLSKASRSLAPPGHSFHGIGDYDVGKIGFGKANFTARFSDTDEFKKMCNLGYVKIRYTRDNRLGVRYEPWHIKVV